MKKTMIENITPYEDINDICFWGKGYAREAVLASLDYGFSKLEINTIVAITQAANSQSCQLLDKVGMKYINNFERFHATQSLYKLTQNEWHTYRKTA